MRPCFSVPLRRPPGTAAVRGRGPARARAVRPARGPALVAAAAALAALLAASVPASAAAGPARPAQPAASARGDHPCLHLPGDDGWYGDNHARLDRVVLRNSPCTGARTRGAAAPVAAFDWDNTVVKNDVGDALLFWMLRHDVVLQPGDWSHLSRWLTPPAAAALTAACGRDTPVGNPLPTGSADGAACADEIMAVYHGRTSGGATAFAGYDHRRFSAGSAWVSQLLTGRTAAQITGYAVRARAAALAAPVGATEQVGSHRVTAWVRYYPQMRALIRTLSADGYAVWVISASPERDVRVWAAGVGVPARHVIGIESLYDAHGRQTAHLAGCGGVPDGADSVLTYVEGKRCFVNQNVFGIHGPAAFRQAPRTRRAVLAAGDSSTDVVFVGDATGLHLTVNRQSAELMCTAYDDADGRWLINPMFLQPLPVRSTPYPCSTTGRVEPDGSPGPVLRADGSVIPDQTDTVP